MVTATPFVREAGSGPADRYPCWTGVHPIEYNVSFHVKICVTYVHAPEQLVD